MSKILITGASGFVGSYLVEEALSRDLDVYAGIRSSSSKRWLQDSRLKFLELDLSNFETLKSTLNHHDFDYIIHNAGLTKTNDLSELYTVNAKFSSNLAKASLSGSRLKKFTFMSSLAAYGTADYQEDGVVSNNSVPHPITSYGKSKLRAERLLTDLSDLPLLIFRPTGIFGPRESDFLQIFKSIKRGLSLQVGFSEQKLSLVYVKDLVRIILKGTLSEKSKKAYFVSDGRIYDGSYFNKLIADSLDVKPIKIKVPLPVISAIAAFADLNSKISGKANILSRDKLPEIKSRNMDCDISNLVQELGFQPEYDLRTAVEETTRWYLEQKWL